MERAQHDPLDGLVGQERFDARLHLLRGFVGERHGQDLPGPDSLHRDEIGDPLGQDARLPRARTGYHQNGTIPRGDGFELLLVKSVKDFHERK